MLNVIGVREITKLCRKIKKLVVRLLMSVMHIPLIVE